MSNYTEELIKAGTIMANLRTEVENFVLKYDSLKVDYEAERKAHEQTKSELAKYRDAFDRERDNYCDLEKQVFQMQKIYEDEVHDHYLTKERLEELEDAVSEYFMHQQTVLATDKLNQAIENSRARNKET